MKYDLMLIGGDVLDPGAGLRGVMDVAIAGGKIAAVAPSLPADAALRTISVKGWLVTPGLVDMHAHVFVNAHDMGSHTDCICQRTGVTTLCDAGSAGRPGADDDVVIGLHDRKVAQPQLVRKSVTMDDCRRGDTRQ